MTVKLPVVVVAAALTITVAIPAHVRGGQAAPAPSAQQQHMAAMAAADAKVDALVQKMNAAKGQAKVDAMAELLTALVDNHKTVCAPMMADMMSTMGTMNHAMPGNAAPKPPPK